MGAFCSRPLWARVQRPRGRSGGATRREFFLAAKGGRGASGATREEEGVVLGVIRGRALVARGLVEGRHAPLRAAAAVAQGRKVAPGVRALVVPGSGIVKQQAEEEGLDKVLLEAGFEWREPGCSMCLGMNPDKLTPGQRSASTSNRNFEGRQGPGGRTHLVSPAMAAAAAVTGRITDVRELV